MARQSTPNAPAGRATAAAKAATGASPVADVLAESIQALTEATRALTGVTGRLSAALGDEDGGARVAGGVRVQVWEDDPFSEAQATPNPANPAPTLAEIPQVDAPLLRVRINDPRPALGQFAPGTPEFRYWVAAEALARGVAFWAALLPRGTRWTTQDPTLRVALVAGQNLNAFYSRVAGLRFFQQTVKGIPIFSGESPDVVLHELGHAVLDALRPQLFHAASLEAAAFHEAFGDMSSILGALQLPTLRARVLEETDGRLARSSRLSRVAEQLGWGIRQLSPSAVDRDSLRNAANRFFYRRPELLPPQAPASQLSSQPHSFSRVFTGAFLDALARMMQLAAPPSDASLRQVSRDMGRLLVDGIRTATITPAYYSQVAAAMIQADRARNNGRYRRALAEAFIERGILSPQAVVNLREAAIPDLVQRGPAEGSLDGGAVAPRWTEAGEDGGGDVVLEYAGAPADDSYRKGFEDAPDLPTFHVEDFGLGTSITLHVPAEEARFAVAPAALDVGAAESIDPRYAGRCFLEDLVRRGRIELGAAAGAVPELEAPSEYKTHVLEEAGEGPTLRRMCFDCGLSIR